jgi:hypothetical protein
MAAASSEDPTAHALVAEQNQIVQSLDEKIKKKLETEEQQALKTAPAPAPDAAAAGDAAAEAQVEELLRDGTSVSDLQRQMTMTTVSKDSAMSSLLEQAVAQSRAQVDEPSTPAPAPVEKVAAPQPSIQTAQAQTTDDKKEGDDAKKEEKPKEEPKKEEPKPEAKPEEPKKEEKKPEEKKEEKKDEKKEEKKEEPNKEEPKKDEAKKDAAPKTDEKKEDKDAKADDFGDGDYDHADHPYYSDPLRHRHPRAGVRDQFDRYGRRPSPVHPMDHLDDRLDHPLDRHPADVHPADLVREAVHYEEPHPLDHLEGLGLSGEEMQGVRSMLHNMHIHDTASADQSITYLKSHVKDMKQELSTL